MKFQLSLITSVLWKMMTAALLFFIIPDLRAQQPASIGEKDPAVKANAASWLKDEYSGFIENKGQLTDQNGKSNTAVKYLLNMPGLNVQLKAAGFSYDAWVYENTASGKTDTRKFHRVDIELEGANAAAILVAEKPLSETSNTVNEHGEFYGIKSYKVVTYKEIYPGIDLEFVATKGTEKPIEYNFIVHPGADASLIKMKYNSGKDISLKNDMIEMKLAFGTLRERIPASYTQQDGKNLAVQYKVLDEARDLYAFNVPAYDKEKTLVIDPSPNLVWSTYTGGSGVLNHNMLSVCKGDAGNIYICGYSNGNTFTATAGAHQAAPSISQDAFLLKFSSSGQRLWATYYGGPGSELGYGVAYDPAGFVYLAGYTGSASGIATADGYQPGITNTGNEMFLAQFNTSGVRQWGTYYGGAGNELCLSVALASDGSVYIGGNSNSAGLATVGQTNLNTNGTTVSSDALLVKFNRAGQRVWATYFGGTQNELNVRCYVDQSTDDVYMAGSTSSPANIASNLTEGQTMTITPTSGFVAKFNAAGGTTWGRYWGPSTISTMSFDPLHNGIYIGSRPSGISPAMGVGITSPDAFQPAPAGGSFDQHLGKIGTNGLWQWGTYIGGNATGTTEAFGGMTSDANGNAYYVFSTTDTDPRLSTDCSFQPTAGGGVIGRQDIVLMKFSPTGKRLWGTFFGKGTHEITNSASSDPLAIGDDGGIYVIGNAEAGSITTAGAFQTTGASTTTTGNGILMKFNEGLLPANFAVAPSLISPLTQTACSLGVPQTLTGNSITPTTPADFATGIFYQWQTATSATGPWTDMAGETFRDMTPPASSGSAFFRRLIKANNGSCDLKVVDSSAVAEVSINANTAPVANADGPQWLLCPGGTIAFTGSAAGGSGTFSSYQWFVGNATTPAVSTPNYTTAAITATTTFTLKVTDDAGCVDIDQVTVAPVAANAGADKPFCAGTSGVQIGAAPIAGAVVYAWTVVSGTAITPANFSCTDCAQPIAKPDVATTYRLTLTVTQKDGTPCSTTDDVIVNPVAAPGNNIAYAGGDQTICKSGSAVLGIASDAAVTSYTWTPGQYLTSNTIANPTFSAGSAAASCPMTFTLTALKGGCTFQDQVSVSVINSEVTGAGGAAVCGPLWSSQSNESNCGSATYGWVLVSGSGTVLSTRNNGADAYLKSNGGTAVFRRTTTVGGLTCNSGDVTVTDACGAAATCGATNISVTSPQGCPKVFGAQDLQLGVSGVNSADYTFSWTPANLVDNPAAPAVTITSTAPATIQVVVTNKYDPSITCTKTIDINNASWTLPVFPVTDKNICPGTPVSIGAASVAGYSYQWSPAAGLNDPAISNPSATLSSSASYGVKVTETATGCAINNNVLVNVTTIDYDAGNNRTVCNGGTVTLGSQPPVGSNYTYSWAPVNSAWQNGTDEHSAQPQVLFASGTPLTFTVTVTDPVTGCSKTDDVTLQASTTQGEYAGTAAAAICPGELVTLGRAAEPNAIYDWTTGATNGLSCTNCSSPTASPATTTNYIVTVSYPGCASPVTDNVTVTVKPATPFDFTDKTICSATPANIGLGGTGNPVSIANAVSYSWSPASGLSCTTCASPNANPQVTTTYTCTITFASGCTLSDNVTVTPQMAVSAKPDAVICPGNSVVIGSLAVPNVTYSWSPATNLSDVNIAQPTVNPAVTTVYTLTATGTGPNAGCTITDAVEIKVSTPIDFTIGGNPLVCTGNSTTIGFAGNPNMLYQWSPVAGVQNPDSSATVVTPPGNTTYKLVQTDLTTGCSNFKEINVVVKPNNLSATGGALSICAGSSNALPLDVAPSGTYAYSWSPATGLSDPFVANPTTYATASTNYMVTVTDNVTRCQTIAPVSVTVLPAGSCNGTDYGDAPASYDENAPASHGLINTLEIGSAIDAEGIPAYSALANGDDNNQVANDEEGVSFLPSVNTATKTVGVVVNDVLNSTGATAYMVGWIDFNRDGDFDDAGERSAVLQVSSAASPASQVLQFRDFNGSCVVKAGPSYLRLRLTTDVSGNWNTNPLPNGSRTNGEVEDYAIIIPGADFGDAPLIYPTARALVNPDIDNDGQPDAAGSVWLGDKVDYPGCASVASADAKADDMDGENDEDGLHSNGIVIGSPVDWDIVVNSQGPVTAVQWGMWIDWNSDGTFDDFKSGNTNTASPTTVNVSVTAPANIATTYMVRLGVKTGTAFTAGDFSYPITNGEWEDYILPASTLPLTLKSFTVAQTACTANITWVTVLEENTSRFELEQSTDGRTWHMVSTMPAAGNAVLGKTYKTTAGLTEGVGNYFRLKMVDKDEHTTYSMTRTVRCAAVRIITINPNPVKDELTISGLTGVNEIRILDNTGRLRLRATATSPTHVMRLGHLKTGVYYAEVVNNGNRVAMGKLLKE
jgi:GEVED domain/Beta-propeller repeat